MPRKTRSKVNQPFLYYLTNIKIALTFTIVAHHMAVASSSFPYTPLMIGAKINWFQFADALFLDLRVTLCPCFTLSVPFFVKQVSVMGDKATLYITRPFATYCLQLW
jgi:hypothetical protein